MYTCSHSVSKVLNPSDDKNDSLPGCGTPAYMPPEAGWNDNDRTVGSSTASASVYSNTATVMTTTTSFSLNLPKFKFKEKFDVYTLGVTLIQLINNEVPDRTRRRVLNDRRNWYDQELLSIIESMVRENPRGRPSLSEICEFTDSSVMSATLSEWHVNEDRAGMFNNLKTARV